MQYEDGILVYFRFSEWGGGGGGGGGESTNSTLWNVNCGLSESSAAETTILRFCFSIVFTKKYVCIDPHLFN